MIEIEEETVTRCENKETGKRAPNLQKLKSNTKDQSEDSFHEHHKTDQENKQIKNQ